MLEFIPNNKKVNNTEEAPCGIPGTSTEPKNDYRAKSILKSKNWFLLEINR